MHAFRDQALQVSDRTLGPDPDRDEGDEHDQGQDERHRDVRRRRVEREPRPVNAEQGELLVAVRRQREIADQVAEPDEQEQRAQEREPPGRQRVGHVSPGDVVAHQRVQDLDGGLDLVRPRLHPPGDPQHHEDRQQSRDDQVDNRAVDAEHAEVDPVDQLELVLDLELVVLVLREAVDDQQQHETRDVDPSADQQNLARLAHRDLGRVSAEVTSWTVKATTMTARQASPASWPSDLRTRMTAIASANRRPSMKPRRRPMARLASVVWEAARSTPTPIARSTIHAPAPIRYPSAGTPIRIMIGAATTSRITSK